MMGAADVRMWFVSHIFAWFPFQGIVFLGLLVFYGFCLLFYIVRLFTFVLLMLSRETQNDILYLLKVLLLFYNFNLNEPRSQTE